MLRDIEGGKPVEGDQILGDLLRRAAKPDAFSLLRVATLHVKAYEAGRKGREVAGSGEACAAGRVGISATASRNLKENALWRTSRRSTGPMR